MAATVKRRKSAEARRRTLVKSGFGVYFAIFLVFIYGPMFAMFILSFQGKRGGTSFPMRGVSLYWWEKLIEPSTVGDMKGALVRSIILALIVMVITALFSTMLGMAFRRPFRGAGALFYTIMAGLMVPGVLLSLGLADPPQAGRHPPQLVVHRARGARGVDPAVRVPGDDGGLQPLRFEPGGGGARHGGERVDGVPGGDPAPHPARDRGRGPVRIHPLLRRVPRARPSSRASSTPSPSTSTRR